MSRGRAGTEAIHEAARVLAGRFVAMIAGILRDDERGDAGREAYRISREVLEEYERSGGRG